MKKTYKSSIIVLKTDKGYLDEDFNPYEEDVDSYDFTNDPECAYWFKNKNSVPHFFRDDKTKTLNDLCKLLNGKLVKLDTVVTTEWKEEDFDENHEGEGEWTVWGTDVYENE